MKKRLTILSISIAVIGVSGMLYVFHLDKGYCRDCPIGVKCMSDFQCDSFRCNLSCQKIDRIGMEKRCVLK